MAAPSYKRDQQVSQAQIEERYEDLIAAATDRLASFIGSSDFSALAPALLPSSESVAVTALSWSLTLSLIRPLFFDPSPLLSLSSDPALSPVHPLLSGPFPLERLRNSPRNLERRTFMIEVFSVVSAVSVVFFGAVLRPKRKN